MKMWKCFVVLALCSSVWAKDVKVIELSNFRHRMLDHQTFQVKNDVRVKIASRGASDNSGYDMLAYGWIVDSRTREVVWKMTVGNSHEERGRYLRESQDSIRLPKGKYEVYYGASPPRRFETRYRDLGDVVDALFGGARRDWKRESRMWGIVLSVDEENVDTLMLLDDSEPQNHVVRLAPVGDDEYGKEGFSLSQRTRVRVYAVGEGDDDEMYDYGWIVNAATGETVWEMDYWDTRDAGGSEKNRMIDEEMVLPAGDYMIHFVTDGSHSYDAWNDLPPHDPRHWGVTLWPTDDTFDKKTVVQPYQPGEKRHIIVAFTRMGNNRYESQRFTVTERTTLHLRCLGEYGYQNAFVDYGWILDARTRKLVWEMTRSNTRHAGGARKNRVFEGTMTLDPGDYEVFYATDGFHSYRRFNASPPYDPEGWGIAIWGAGSDFDPESVVLYDEGEDSDVLVRIMRVGNRERIRRRFTLEIDASVRIYALGEGEDDEMFDYGWIENERGRPVWKMDYWDTDRAGGSRKNRMINEVIHLDAGEYIVFYRSDDSHSFDAWNAAPPRDPAHWGIVVTRER